MSNYEIIDSSGNVAETGTDPAILFARLADLNGPRGDLGYTMRRAANGLPAAPVIAAPAVLEVALSAWVADGPDRVRCTPANVYRWMSTGEIHVGSEVIGNAPRTQRGVQAAEETIAAYERPPLPVVEVADRQIIPGVTVDPVARDRILRSQQILTESGISIPEMWFAPGTDLLPSGKDAFYSLTRAFETQRSFLDVANEAIEAIEAQDRHDIIIEPGAVKDIRLEDGWVHFEGMQARLGANALRDLLGKYPEVFPASGRWAAIMGRAALEASFNDGFDRWGRKDIDRGMQMRVRRHAITGEPTIWAVVGPQYPGRETDADVILREMIRQVGGDRSVRGEVTVDPNTGRMLARAIWQDTHIRNPAVGDVFRATLIGQSRDDAKGAFRGSAGVTAIRCINCSLSESAWGEGRGIHRSVESILKAVGSAFDGFHAKADRLLTAWGYATQADLEVEENGTVLQGTDAVTAFCRQNELVLEGWASAGLSPDSADAILADAVDRERNEGRVDGSLADVLRAIAAMAQDRRLDAFARVEIETLSGRLVPILAVAAQEATT